MQALMRVARRQFGVFSTQQAAAAGISRHQLGTLVGRKLVERRRPGIYRVAGTPLTHEQQVMEAVLAAPGAVGSHESAAHLLGLVGAPSQVHVTVNPDRRLRFEGVVAHRSPLPSSHMAQVGPLPITSLARTIVDLASMSDLDRLAGIMDPLLVSKRLHPTRLLRVLDEIVEAPGRHGTTLLRGALAIWTEPIRPGSVAEVRLLRHLSERGFGGFVTQQHVEVGDRSYFLDVAWPDEKISLEYSGKPFHGPRSWDRDERRAMSIKALGWESKEVDVADLVPGSTSLWSWLDRRLGRRAA